MTQNGLFKSLREEDSGDFLALKITRSVFIFSEVTANQRRNIKKKPKVVRFGLLGHESASGIFYRKAKSSGPSWVPDPKKSGITVVAVVAVDVVAMDDPR